MISKIVIGSPFHHIRDGCGAVLLLDFMEKHIINTGVKSFHLAVPLSSVYVIYHFCRLKIRTTRDVLPERVQTYQNIVL